LRQLRVPLAEIKAILPHEPVQAAERVREFWAATDAEHTARRALAAYLIDELSGKGSIVYEVTPSEMPERSLLCLKRNVFGRDRAWAFGKEFIALLRHYQLPPIQGRAGAFSVSTGVRSARTATVRWSRAVPSQQTRRKRWPPAARS
jgi:hypothetical protein